MIKLFGNRLDYLHEKFVVNEKRKQDKLAKYNKVHKEGFDAGYKKGYKKGMEDKEKELCQNALNKHNPDYLPSWYTQNKDL